MRGACGWVFEMGFELNSVWCIFATLTRVVVRSRETPTPEGPKIVFRQADSTRIGRIDIGRIDIHN